MCDIDLVYNENNNFTISTVSTGLSALPRCEEIRGNRRNFWIGCIYSRSCLFLFVFFFFSFLSKQREIKLPDRFFLRFESIFFNLRFLYETQLELFFISSFLLLPFTYSRSQSMRNVSSAYPSIEYVNIPVYPGTPLTARRSFDLLFSRNSCRLYREMIMKLYFEQRQENNRAIRGREERNVRPLWPWKFFGVIVKE